jgi:hypothetical protein
MDRRGQRPRERRRRHSRLDTSQHDYDYAAMRCAGPPHAAGPAGASRVSAPACGRLLHALNPAAPSAAPSCASERRIPPSPPRAAAKARAVSKEATRAANEWPSRGADPAFGGPVPALVKTRMGRVLAPDRNANSSFIRAAPFPISRSTFASLPNPSPAVITGCAGSCMRHVDRTGAASCAAVDRKSRATAPNLAASASYICSCAEAEHRS